MNRKQKREYQRYAIPRIQQLLNSKLIHSNKLDGLSEEEVNLLKEDNHTDKSLQTLFNKQKKLILELDNLLSQGKQ